MASIDWIKAKDLLTKGTPVAIPTETVYGLAAPISNVLALEKIFAIKKRPSFDPLIVHVASLEQAEELGTWDPLSRHLAQRFWPGPLSLIIPKTSKVPGIVTSGGSTVAIRAPGNEGLRQLIEQTGPLAAPSANRFSKTSPTTAKHVTDEFQDTVPVVDGGPCRLGVESTIVQVTDASRGHINLLRPGQISQEQLHSALETMGCTDIEITIKTQENAPGHLKNHYQPDCPLVLMESAVEWTPDIRQDVAKALGIPESGKWLWLELSPEAPLAARNLYAELRRGSDLSPQVLLCRFRGEQFHQPLWRAILDRLQKASTLRLEKNVQNQTIFYSKGEDRV